VVAGRFRFLGLLLDSRTPCGPPRCRVGTSCRPWKQPLGNDRRSFEYPIRRTAGSARRRRSAGGYASHIEFASEPTGKSGWRTRVTARCLRGGQCVRVEHSKSGRSGFKARSVETCAQRQLRPRMKFIHPKPQCVGRGLGYQGAKQRTPSRFREPTASGASQRISFRKASSPAVKPLSMCNQSDVVVLFLITGSRENVFPEESETVIVYEKSPESMQQSRSETIWG